MAANPTTFSVTDFPGQMVTAVAAASDAERTFLADRLEAIEATG